MGNIGIIDVITQSFAMLKGNVMAAWPFAIFTVIISALALGAILGSLYLPNPAIQSTSIANPLSVVWAVISAMVVVMVVSFLVSPIVNGIYLSGANTAAGTSKKAINLSKGFKEAKQRYFSLLGANVLSSIILLVAVGIPILIALAVPFASSFFTGMQQSPYGIITPPPAWAGAATVIAIIVAIIDFIVFYPLLFLSQAAVIVGKNRAVTAVKSSIRIGRASFWKMLGIVILLFLITIAADIIASIIAAPFALTGAVGAIAAQATLHIIVSIFIGMLFLFAQVIACRAYLKSGKAASSNK